MTTMDVTRILHLGATEAERRSIGVARIFSAGFTFFSKKLTTFFSRRPYFGIFEAHRTLLVERTVLLYSINQAIRPNKASFFFEKNHSIDDWGHGP